MTHIYVTSLQSLIKRPTKRNPIMKLSKLINLELFITKLSGQGPLIFCKSNQRYIYSKALNIFQVFGLILYAFIKSRFQKYEDDQSEANDHDLPTKDQNADLFVVLTIIGLFNFFENYVWYVLSAIRFFKRESFAHVYNSLLDLDRAQRQLQHQPYYIQKITRRFFTRITMIIFWNLLLVYDEFQPYSFRRTLTVRISAIIIRFVWGIIYLQQFTAYDVLTQKAEALSQALNTFRSVESLETSHRVLMKIIHTKRLTDKTFNQQSIVGTSGILMMLISLCYMRSIRIQFNVNFFLHKSDNFLFERNIIILLVWLYASFRVVEDCRQATKKLIKTFQLCAEQFETRNSFYSFVEFGVYKDCLTTGTFIGSAGMRTMFNIFRQIISVVVIIHQFRQIAVLKQERSH